MNQQANTAIAVLDEMIQEFYFDSARVFILNEAKSRIQELDDMSNNGWIPVTDRLPDNWQRVIVYLEPIDDLVDYDIKDARFFSDKLWTRFRVWAWEFVHWMYVKHKEYIQRDTDDILYKVTHWQPLPLPPNK